MRSRFTSSRVLTILALSLTAVFLMSAEGDADSPKGLNNQAAKELSDVGVDKYLGAFTPVSVRRSGHGGWTKHTFDPQDVRSRTPWVSGRTARSALRAATIPSSRKQAIPRSC